MIPNLEEALDKAKKKAAEFQFTYLQLSAEDQALVDIMWKAGYLQGRMDRMNIHVPEQGDRNVKGG